MKWLGLYIFTYACCKIVGKPEISQALCKQSTTSEFDFNALFLSFLPISPGLPSRLSSLHHLRNSTTLHCECWGGIRVLDIWMLYDYINTHLSNRSCHWNKSQAIRGKGPKLCKSHSILPQQKIGAPRNNLWSFPNISPVIQEALVGPLYILVEDKNNLLDIALHHQEWQNWPQQRATKTNLIWLFNFTVTDPAVMRCLPSLLVKNLNAIYNMKQGSVKMSCRAPCDSRFSSCLNP